MRKLLVIFSIFLMTLLCSISAFAANVDDGGQWEYQTYGSGVELTSYKGTLTDVYVPSKIEVGGSSLSVIKLGDELFKGNTTLNSATLGEGITEIGASAFEDATSLVCIVTPESLTTIGEKAFSGCTAFNSVILYDAVTSIGKNAFADCKKVTVYCNEDTSAYNYVIANGISYKILNPNAEPEIVSLNGVEYYIMNGEAIAISFDKSTTSVTIPSTVEGYPVTELRNTFEQCSSLTSITLPQSLKIIGDEEFYACSNLFSITIPDSVTSIGDYAFSYCSNLARITIPDNVTRIGNSVFSHCSRLISITIPDSVTSIGKYAFSNCSKLVSITIPDSVTSIEEYAFSDCSKLASVTIPDSVPSIAGHVFSNCSSLASITIPDSVTSIESFTFAGCSSLTSITIPNSVKKIGFNTFSGCSNLARITIPDSVTSIGSYAFSDCSNLTSITIPNSVTSISSNTFSGCSSLTSITIPDSVTRIGDSAFKNCKNLTTVIIPESVNSISTNSFYENTIWLVYENSYAHTSAKNNDLLYFVISENSTPETHTVGGITYFIANGEAIAISFDKSTTTVTIPETVAGYPVTELRNTFYDCKSLTSVTLPKSLKTIGNKAFYYCYNLNNMIIPDGVTSIGDSAFIYCSGLKNITIPDSVTSIGDSAFIYCIRLINIEIPNNVTNIGMKAFSDCLGLTSITIPDSVTSIKSSTFSGCSSLTSVEIPDNVTSIGSYAFSDCSNLARITIPDSVTSIERYAFSGCCSLTSITIPDSITSIGDYAFNNCTNLTTVIIPESVNSISTNSFYENTIWLVYENSYAHTMAENNDLLYFVISENSTPETHTVDGITYFIANGEALAISFDKSTTTVTIPETVAGYPVTELRKTFKNCTSLTSVTLPKSLKIIGNGAFFNCSSLTSITIPDSVTSIEDYAFSNCSSFTSVEIPDNVTSIGSYAFSNCSKLASITIPDSITSIERCAFSDCGKLASITIPDSVTSIGDYAFSNCSSLTSVEISDSVTSIGLYAFSNCSSLTSITIPDSVTSIDGCAFRYCNSLTSITIPDSVTSIKAYTFSDCSNLTNITIPDSVTYISYFACINCPLLTKVIIPESVKSISSNSFDENTIWLVYKNSNAHTFAVNHDLLYFVLHKTENPETAYGSGISGTATYTDGTAASGATVEILYDDGTVKESVTTDATGAYSFTYAEVGRYTIRVTDTLGNTASEVVSVKRMNVFDVYLSGETDLVLKKGYNVSGTVSPAAAKITISDTKGNIIKSLNTTDGTFTFGNIPRGSYIIKAENNNGSATTEIYVSNEDVTGISLEVQAQSATITGDTKIENRDGTYSAKIWVNIDLIDAEGNVVASTKTDTDGKYTFNNVPAGSYSIVATINEMRPDLTHGFDKSHELKGYGHIDVTEFTEYTIGTITLREDKVNLTSVSGKVTANGVTQDCQVILTNESGDQIAVFVTDNNGKYNFINIPDGMYSITAITKVDGMGITVITIKNGVVYGDTDIKVTKADKISAREETLLNIPDCNTKEEALIYKEAILVEKQFYDSLSEKERKQLSEEWIDKLFKLVDLISNSTMNTTEGVMVENEASIISSNEIDKTITFTLTVTEAAAVDAGADGINTEEEYETEKIKDKGKNKNIAKYYDITFSKDGQNISNIQKQTETNGKLRITMEIPEKYRGHKHYTFIHMHNGEAVTLVDLDNDPNTVTFEIDKFSTFALAYSDVELIGEVEETIYPASIVYDGATGKISVSSTEDGILYIATYNGSLLTDVKKYDIPADAIAEEYEFGTNQAAFVWDENMRPLCEKFKL